jgi:pimeloyl-ACP methyl ester carboxylesterase
MSERTPVPVEIQTDDDTTLRGLQWPGSDAWLVFLHDRDNQSDLDAWRPLLLNLSQPDWSMLALDLRSHGASDSTESDVDAVRDLERVLAYVRGEGAVWIALLASGKSAIDALEATATERLDALVLLSPAPANPEASHELRGRGEAKLIIVGQQEPALRRATERLRNRAIGWTMLVALPVEAHGTDLLTGALASQAHERIVAFLSEQRFLATTRGLSMERSSSLRGEP